MIHSGNTGRKEPLAEFLRKFGLMIKKLIFTRLFCFMHYKGNWLFYIEFLTWNKYCTLFGFSRWTLKSVTRGIFEKGKAWMWYKQKRGNSKVKPTWTVCKFKIFGVRKCQKKFKKGIACGYRMQEVSKITPVYMLPNWPQKQHFSSIHVPFLVSIIGLIPVWFWGNLKQRMLALREIQLI